MTKFELTVQPEVSAASLARGEQRTAIPQDSPSKLAIVTTDAVANVLQQQLPPRVVPVLRVVPEQKPADRSKRNWDQPLISRCHRRHATSTISFAPQSGSISRLQHIRSNFKSSSSAGCAHGRHASGRSRLRVVRIQQRSSGEVTLQLNARQRESQQNLQSSVASLAQALKLENVSVSGIEVSRKSPADKVRRMKETH